MRKIDFGEIAFELYKGEGHFNFNEDVKIHKFIESKHFGEF